MKTRPETVEVVRILMDSKGEIVSGGRLAERLSLSRQSIWRTIRNLLEEGFLIDPIPQKGYMFRGEPRYDLAPSFVGVLLQGSVFSKAGIHVFDTLASTQITAKQLGRQGGLESVVVFSEEQTRGRGRRTRNWISHRGAGLFLSVFFRPRLFPGSLQLVNLAAGLAVKNAVATQYSVDLSLKWPNDLLWENRKMCGILSEASSESDRVLDCCTGIGLNISAPPPPYDQEWEAVLSRASFLSDIAGDVHRGILAAEILRRFSALLSELELDGGRALINLYRESCSTLGREVIVHTDEGTEHGHAESIGENGELIVLTQRGLVSYCAADVVHATLGMR